jgi:hypothetical protein
MRCHGYSLTDGSLGSLMDRRIIGERSDAVLVG